MIDIFISYQHQDKKYAHALAKKFAMEGYKVWWDIDLLPGQKFADEINSIIKRAKVTIVLWTEKSIASDWVKAETTLAMSESILIPIWLERVSLPAPYNTLHTLDLTTWDGEYNSPDLNKLLKAIQNIVGKQTSPVESLNLREVEVVLEKPAHEVEFWITISNKEPQLVSEYEAYLEKYGSNGSFSELAHIRIIELKKKKYNLKTIITMSGIAVGIIVGIFQIYDIVNRPKPKITIPVIPSEPKQPIPVNPSEPIKPIPAVLPVPKRPLTIRLAQPKRPSIELCNGAKACGAKVNLPNFELDAGNWNINGAFWETDPKVTAAQVCRIHGYEYQDHKIYNKPIGCGKLYSLIFLKDKTNFYHYKVPICNRKIAKVINNITCYKK